MKFLSKPKTNLLVKDILPELEKAGDVRQRIEEVRAKRQQNQSPQQWQLEPGRVIFSNVSSSWAAVSLVTKTTTTANSTDTLWTGQVY